MRGDGISVASFFICTFHGAYNGLYFGSHAQKNDHIGKIFFGIFINIAYILRHTKWDF